ncbi:MAG: 6-phosphogluconolactonase [Candidatus Brocadia carolinensis]|uniref:6-phosphogluconolactonase n=1 Tax=Candidatus Brocadia carolinensis TaxID=1004156 RepID=A0A1V4APW5_9BACT|nr:MAG: 6-phosphogluconolactonase [Candidatus Brocadia caroliniensis]
MTKTTGKREILIVGNSDELSHRAAQEFVRLADEAIRTKGFFTVALSGGSTPRGLYLQLASDAYRELVSWPHVHLFWGDERCVPPDHPESNYRMACEALINRVSIPKENIYRIPAEQEDRARAAMEYGQALKSFFRLNAGAFPRFDLILLGMGDDGHTASLFPFTTALDETGSLVLAHYVEKLGAYRFTLSVPTINQTREAMFLISGASKAPVLREVLEGDYQPQRLPAQIIQPVNGRLLFIVDREAAGKLRQTGV